MQVDAVNFFSELQRRLATEGIRTLPPAEDRLPIMLEDREVGVVIPSGGMRYREGALDTEAAHDLFYRAAAVADEVHSYMELLDSAPPLKAQGLDEQYEGQHLPAYLYEPCELMVELTARDAEPDAAAEYLYLPTTRTQIERAMLRAGANTFEDLSLRFVESELPDEVDVRLDMEHEGLTDLNEMCAAIKPLNPEQRSKLGAVVEFAKPEYASQIKQLAENLELFDFVPKVSSPEEYGRYMIQESGHFDFDENLEDYYDYTGYAESRMREEMGQFGDRGYVSYHGTLSLDELMMDDPTQTHGFEMGGLR